MVKSPGPRRVGVEPSLNNWANFFLLEQIHSVTETGAGLHKVVPKAVRAPEVCVEGVVARDVRNRIREICLHPPLHRKVRLPQKEKNHLGNFDLSG